MSRVIKFRVWDKMNRIMSEGVEMSWFVTGQPEDMRFPSTDESIPLYDFRLYLDDYEFLQFTGKEDKECVEIYDGDILENWFVGQHSVGFVHFDEAAACFVIQWTKKGNPDSQYNNLLHVWADSVKVIGNIYEKSAVLTA